MHIKLIGIWLKYFLSESLSKSKTSQERARHLSEGATVRGAARPREVARDSRLPTPPGGVTYSQSVSVTADRGERSERSLPPRPRVRVVSFTCCVVRLTRREWSEEKNWRCGRRRNPEDPRIFLAETVKGCAGRIKTSSTTGHECHGIATVNATPGK